MLFSPSRNSRGRLYRAGFTLIELMIVVAILAILSAIAYPSYITHVTKTHRVAAEGCLSEYTNWMERFYTTNLKYNLDLNGNAVAPPFPGSASVMDCASTNQTGANYNYQFVAAPTATTYAIEAIPYGAQASRDTQCGTLSVDQTGTRTISGTGTLAECW